MGELSVFQLVQMYLASNGQKLAESSLQAAHDWTMGQALTIDATYKVPNLDVILLQLMETLTTARKEVQQMMVQSDNPSDELITLTLPARRRKRKQRSIASSREPPETTEINHQISADADETTEKARAITDSPSTIVCSEEPAETTEMNIEIGQDNADEMTEKARAIIDSPKDTEPASKVSPYFNNTEFDDDMAKRQTAPVYEPETNGEPSENTTDLAGNVLEKKNKKTVNAAVNAEIQIIKLEPDIPMAPVLPFDDIIE